MPSNVSQKDCAGPTGARAISSAALNSAISGSIFAKPLACLVMSIALPFGSIFALPSRLAALQTAPAVELKEQWRALFGKEPPPFNRPYLVSRLSYRVQELAYGGLKSETRARLEALGEQLDGGNVVLRRIRADSRPLPGTRLLREYDGVQHVVTVRADDFEYEGRPYRSLSAIARHITGMRWSGWTFFGLKGRPGA